MCQEKALDINFLSFNSLIYQYSGKSNSDTKEKIQHEIQEKSKWT